MKQHFLAVAAIFALGAAPVFADEARTPPPTEPYYAPDTTTCDLVRLKVYFEPGTATLTPFARDAIREAGEQLEGCAITGMTAVAVAGGVQSETPTVTLAQERRDTVLKELTAHGIGTSSPAMALDLGHSVMSRSVDIELQTLPVSFG